MKKVAPRVRPTPGMHHIFAPNFPITGINVRLQDACKFPKELPGALSATIQLEIEHYRSARSTILPEISPVILALGSFGLHIDGRFIVNPLSQDICGRPRMTVIENGSSFFAKTHWKQFVCQISNEINRFSLLKLGLRW